MKAFSLLIITLIMSMSLIAQLQIPKQELVERRENLFKKIGNGNALIWGAQSPSSPVRFIQSPDFYYFTGLEEQNGILLMIGKTKKTYVFSKETTEKEVRWNGPGAWLIKDIKEELGIDQLLPFENFWEMLAGNNRDSSILYLPLNPADKIDGASGEVFMSELNALRHPIKPMPFWKQAIKDIKEILPTTTMKNINPLLDELRLIKTPYEIEQFKMSGKIGAEGVLEAIKDTRPGMYEYEIEATASFFYTKRGARGPAFAPIVASGPTTYIVHYEANDRLVEKEDFVLMDYGCNYNYYASDITRVWPASGKFSAEEEKMYNCILEASKTIIAAMKPGVTFGSLRDTAYSVYKKHGFADKALSWNGYIGHFIGMSTHDVGNPGNANKLVAGMVFNVEPVLDDPIKKRHMRLEDTVLITETGAINLTAGVPVELADIYALMKKKGLTGN